MTDKLKAGDRLLITEHEPYGTRLARGDKVTVVEPVYDEEGEVTVSEDDGYHWYLRPGEGYTRICGPEQQRAPVPAFSAGYQERTVKTTQRVPVVHAQLSLNDAQDVLRALERLTFHEMSPVSERLHGQLRAAIEKAELRAD